MFIFNEKKKLWFYLESFRTPLFLIDWKITGYLQLFSQWTYQGMNISRIEQTWNVSSIFEISLASKPGKTELRSAMAWLRYGLSESSSIVCSAPRLRLPKLESSRTSVTQTAISAFMDCTRRWGSTTVSSAGYTLQKIDSSNNRSFDAYLSDVKKEEIRNVFNQNLIFLLKKKKKFFQETKTSCSIHNIIKDALL